MHKKRGGRAIGEIALSCVTAAVLICANTQHQ